jgi:hypothetical protein
MEFNSVMKRNQGSINNKNESQILVTNERDQSKEGYTYRTLHKNKSEFYSM